MSYRSLNKLSRYLYEISFSEIPEYVEGDPEISGACSSYVKDGKLYRNLDWDYDRNVSFHVMCNGFEGMAFIPGLTDTSLDDSLLDQLPYRLLDGRNDHGIMVSTHVLFNDWEWTGSGSTPLYKMPFLVLSTVESMASIEADLADVLSDLVVSPTLVASDYLLQFIVTDGTTTYVITPPESSDGYYSLVNATSNPKLANFRWVPNATVTRTELQNRPTGVERWNMMPCELKDLRFTKAYEEPTRLSEFIGLRKTTKDSSDSELESIFEAAKALYESRSRDGTTWQTMHSVVYSPGSLDVLCIQENWKRNYCDPLPIDEQVTFLKGTLSCNKILGGKITSTTRLSAVVTIPTIFDDPVEPYEGPVDILPSFDGSVLETKNKKLLDDLTIEPIPVYRVTNPTGGVTIVIGGNTNG